MYTIPGTAVAFSGAFDWLRSQAGRDGGFAVKLTAKGALPL
jgi:hypothetical protein